MTFKYPMKPNSLPSDCHRNRMPDSACMSFMFLRFGLLCAVFSVLAALGSGSAVADCINPVALWKLEESGAVPDYQDELNPGDHIGACRTVDSIAVCPEPVEARYGIGQKFYDGAQLSGIDIPSCAIFNWSGTDSFSISFWMKRDRTPLLKDNEVIIGRDSVESGNDLHWWIGVEQGGVAEAVFITRKKAPSYKNRHLRTDKRLTDNHWHFIVFVRNGATSENRLYVDGQLENKVFITYTDGDGFDADTTAINIGWISLDPKYQYKGMVDEIALYHTALPQWFIHDRYHADARYTSDQTDPCD